MASPAVRHDYSFLPLAVPGLPESETRRTCSELSQGSSREVRSNACQTRRFLIARFLSPRQIEENATEVSNTHHQCSPFDHLICNVPFGKLSDFICESSFGLQVVGIRFPPDLPHIDAGLLPEITIGGKKVSTAESSPKWQQPIERNRVFHRMNKPAVYPPEFMAQDFKVFLLTGIPCVLL